MYNCIACHLPLVQVLAGYLMFGTVSGIMMALFLDNVGGAWDNAKKYVEVTHTTDVTDCICTL